MMSTRPKFLPIIVLAPTILFISVPLQAADCGGGKVLEIKEGGWNKDDLLIKIDYSGAVNRHNGTEFQGYIRYSALSLSTTRLEAIRRLAITAMLAGKTISTYSHNNRCDNSTEFTIFSAG